MSVRASVNCLITLLFVMQLSAAKALAADVPTPLELEALVDTVMAESMATNRVPGASLAIVYDGQVFLAKGYGVAAIEQDVAVTANTPFRVASLSKLLTATAVLQLVDRGDLALHDDIGQYLTMPLVRSFKTPVTVHHLLTHTSGFEITDIGDAARTPEDLLSLAQLVDTRMTGQSHAPGEIFAYSNHGFVLLGLLIEAVTRKPFAEALDDLVMRPLSMKDSTFRQPLPEAISRGISRSYSSSLEPLQRDYSQIAPADALVSTANDMAAFMLAQLEGHATWNEGLLETMQSQQYAPYPTRYGMAYAWQETTLRGHRALEHSGGQLGFASYMVIIPEQRFGYFITQNRREGALRHAPLDAILDAFLDRIVHDLPAPVEPPRNLGNLLPEYAGYYVSAEYPRHSFERLLYELAFLGRDVVVRKVPDCGEPVACRADALAINSERDRYYEFATNTFQHPTAWWATAAIFPVAGTGKQRLYLDRAAYEKRPAWRLPALQRLLVVLALPLAFFGALIWPFRARRLVDETRLSRYCRWTVQAGAGVGLLTLLALFLVLRIYLMDEVQMDYGVRAEVYFLMFLADTLKLAAPVVALVTVIAIIRRYWSVLLRSYAALLSASLAYVAWLLHLSNVTL